MAITNLGTLQDAVESWMERTLDDALFIEFAAEITNVLLYGMRDQSDRNWIVPPLRSRLMHTTDTLSVSSASAALPADWLEFDRIWIDTNTGQPLRYVSLEEFWADWRSQQSGEPAIYTIDGDTMRFAPTSDATVQISYYQTLGALASDSDTNVILTAHPQVYRHGCLWKSFDWEGNLERSDRELLAFAASVKGLNAQRKQAQTSGSQLRMRPNSVV